MKNFGASIAIDATPEAVWAVLADTSRWPTFDPYCERIEGEPAMGAALTVYTPLAPGRAFPVKIVSFEPPRELAWTGGLPLGMLSTVRTHRIIAEGAGSRLEVNEVITGPLLKAIAGSLPDLNEAFAAFCDGLKRQVEGRA